MQDDGLEMAIKKRLQMGEGGGPFFSRGGL